jgi:pantetheine-phosphate adenylyltransferase
MTIGLYAGSFDPFHKGHYDIINKAEKIFDKVVIVRGVNPDKVASSWELPNSIKDKVIKMGPNDLITDVIKSLKGNAGDDNKVTLIRGLRNSHDLQAELNYYYVLQDLMPEIQVISILCDRNLQHISSSLIRSLKRYSDDTYKNYLVE